jgi:hypothetical protein
MYGLINSALQDMIVTHFGEDKWRRCTHSGVPEDSFLTMRRYDDEITYRSPEPPRRYSVRRWTTAWRCSATTGWRLSPTELRHADGCDGQRYVRFLHNVNALHDRITSTFLDYIPPEFRLEDIDPDAAATTCTTTRSARVSRPLSPGCWNGLAEHFGDEHRDPSASPSTTAARAPTASSSLTVQ